MIVIVMVMVMGMVMVIGIGIENEKIIEIGKEIEKVMIWYIFARLISYHNVCFWWCFINRANR